MRPIQSFLVNPILVHFPEWRHFSQFCHGANHEIGYVVYFFLRVKATDAKPDARVRILIVKPNRT